MEPAACGAATCGAIATTSYSKLATLLLERGKPADALALVEKQLQQDSLTNSSGNGSGGSLDLLTQRAHCMLALGNLPEVRPPHSRQSDFCRMVVRR